MGIEAVTTPAGNQPGISSRPMTVHALRDGFDLFTLRNAGLELAVAPALGAKVVSLKNLLTGREWLWHPIPGMRLFRNQPGDDFRSECRLGTRCRPGPGGESRFPQEPAHGTRMALAPHPWHEAVSQPAGRRFQI